MKVALVMVWLCLIASGAMAESNFSCRDWAALAPDKQLQVMERFIATEKEQKVVLKLSPSYYTRKLNALTETFSERQNKSALDFSFEATIHTIAAIEGDWGNGEPPIDHAKRWLGAKGFALFKELYPARYRRLRKASEPSLP